MVAMIALDAVWLSTMEGVSIALNWDICSPSALARPSVAFYALYLFGVVYFATIPARRRGMAKGAFQRRAAGASGVWNYDLTNQANAARLADDGDDI